MDNIIVPIALVVPIVGLIFAAGIQWQRMNEHRRRMDEFDRFRVVVEKKMRLPANYEYGNGGSST